MNAKHISIIVAVVALLAGCAKSPIEEVKPSEQLADLELSYVGATETKAAIDGTDFPEKGEIGLFLFKDELAETPYGKSGYTNVKYSYDSGKKKWTASPSIKVGSTPGYLYGYYPYNSESTDVKEIPVVSSLNGNDVMYASQVKNVTDKTYTISQISSDITLKAVFGYQITTEVKPAWAGTVTGAGFYPKNSTATLTATAGGSGGKFIGWAEKDSPETTISTDNPYTFTVSGLASYVAVFDVTDVLPSLFTVNSSGTQVRFSKGNLWCDNDANTTNSHFHFEEHQYDSTPTRDVSRSTEHISHFLWCKSASESVKEKYSETGTGTNDKFFTDNDDFAVNGVSSWRTLGSGEWKYLLDTRTTAYGSNRRYAAVKVNGMAGLLIFPDDFSSWPSGAGDEPQTFNTNGSNWNNKNYTVEQFKVLQDNGCVFLPAAGNRDGDPSSPNLAKVNLVGYSGYYWSASPYDNKANDLRFGGSNVKPDASDARSSAQSVRLVTECQRESRAE